MAARFRFRLEALLKLRHSLEQEAQRNLARMVALQAAAQAKLDQLKQTQAETVDGRRLAPNQVVNLEQLRASERYLLVVERRIQWAGQELREAEELVAGARLALLKAHQDHLMLQRLKERRLEQHDLERQRDEAKDMDEIAVLRHRLGRSGNPSGTQEVFP